MKYIWTIFMRDLKRIGSNPIALVVAAGIMVLPSLYAWFNIAANWDPYGNTRGLKVAVASLDEGIDIEGIKANIGEMIMDHLRKNEQIGWQFVDEETAMSGVEDGSYYAAVIIPENFSSRISSILTTDVEKPEIHYYVNEKRNAIATKITDKGVSAIQQQVNETFISATSQVVGKLLNSSSEDINGKKESLADEMVNTLEDAKEDLNNLSSSVSVFRSTLLSVKDLMQGVQKTLPNADALVDDGKMSTAKVKETVRVTQDMSDAVTDSISQVMDTAENLQDSLDSEFTYLNRQIGKNTEAAAEALGNIETQLKHLAEFNRELEATLSGINTKLPIPLTGMTQMSAQLSANEQKQRELAGKVHDLKKTIETTGSLPEHAREDINVAYDEVKNSLGDTRTFYRDNVKEELRKSLDQAYDSMDAAAAVLEDMGETIPKIDSVLTSTADSFDHQIEALDKVSEIVERGRKKIDDIIISVNEVSDNEKLGKLLEILQNDPKVMSEFLSSPVELQVNKVYPIENYGSAMTPFYTILAIWVGGLVLVAVLKCKVKEDQELKGLKPWEMYFGRYMTFMVFGIVQALIVSLGDLYLLKIQCLNPGLFVLAAVIASVIFTNIIYTLTISFGDVGKAVAVVLLVIQVAGAGGTFPIEVTPHFFQAVNPMLPFTHMINAMRECVAGIYGNAYVLDLAKVAVYLPISLLVGTVLRKPLIRFNEFMEEKLEETGIM